LDVHEGVAAEVAIQGEFYPFKSSPLVTHNPEQLSREFPTRIVPCGHRATPKHTAWREPANLFKLLGGQLAGKGHVSTSRAPELTRKPRLILLKNKRELLGQSVHSSRVQERRVGMQGRHLHGCGQHLTISGENFPSGSLHCHSMLKLNGGLGL
jgi:hypothetical protein